MKCIHQKSFAKWDNVNRKVVHGGYECTKNKHGVCDNTCKNKTCFVPKEFFK